MNWKNTTERYGSLSISLHWFMLLLLFGVYLCINLHNWAPKGSDLRQTFKTWHFMLGLSVLALVVVRLAARFLMPNPRLLPEIPAWQRHSALLMHGTLYAFMLLMPILGWTTLSSGGKVIPFFGLHLPPLMDVDKLLSRSVKEIHETLGTIGYYLIGLHAAAALFHHYFVRDGTLLRMLPRRREP
ncbi:MAG: cytochrome b [Rhodanobacter sp.]